MNTKKNTLFIINNIGIVFLKVLEWNYLIMKLILVLASITV